MFKSIWSFLMVLVLFAFSADAAIEKGSGGASTPSVWEICVDDNGYCLDSDLDGETDFRMGADGTITMGDAVFKENNTETKINSRSFLNSEDEVVVGYYSAYIVLDNIKGTEDTAYINYVIESGTYCVVSYFGPPLSEAPLWVPCTGCVIFSSGTGSAPFNVVGPLFWSGSAWVVY